MSYNKNNSSNIPYQKLDDPNKTKSSTNLDSLIQGFKNLSISSNNYSKNADERTPLIKKEKK